MPNEERTSAEKVTAAIVTGYQQAGDRAPTAGELIALSGVSSATYYRVVQNDPQAQATLAAAKSAFNATKNGPEQPYDPVTDQPHAVVKELKQTIAALLSIIETQSEQIERLTDQMASGGSVTQIRPSTAVRVRQHPEG